MLATPHKDAVVDHEHDSGRENSDEGNGEGGERDSRAISVHERKKEGEQGMDRNNKEIKQIQRR